MIYAHFFLWAFTHDAIFISLKKDISAAWQITPNTARSIFYFASALCVHRCSPPGDDNIRELWVLSKYFPASPHASARLIRPTYRAWCRCAAATLHTRQQLPRTHTYMMDTLAYIAAQAILFYISALIRYYIATFRAAAIRRDISLPYRVRDRRHNKLLCRQLPCHNSPALRHIYAFIFSHFHTYAPPRHKFTSAPSASPQLDYTQCPIFASSYWKAPPHDILISMLYLILQ